MTCPIASMENVASSQIQLERGSHVPSLRALVLTDYLVCTPNTTRPHADRTERVFLCCYQSENTTSFRVLEPIAPEEVLMVT